MARRSAQQFYDQRMRSIERRRILRPMTASEIIDLASRAYQILAGPILRLTLVPMLFCYAGLLFYDKFIAPNLFTTGNPADSKAQVVELGVALGLGLLIALPLFLIGLAYATGLTVRLVSDFMVSPKIDPDAAAADARRTTGVMLRALLRILFTTLAPAGIGIGFLFLSNVLEGAGLAGDAYAVLPGILGLIGILFGTLVVPLFLYQFALAPAAVVFEAASPREALRRSRILIRHVRYHTSPGEVVVTLLLLLGVSALAVLGGLALALRIVPVEETVANLAVLGPFAGVAAAAVEMLPYFVTLWLLVPVWTTTMTILYFDRIMRLEAYDIKLLAQDVLKADRKTVLLS